MQRRRCGPVDLKVTGGQIVDQGGHGARLAEQGPVCLQLTAVANGLGMIIEIFIDKLFRVEPPPTLPAAGRPLSAQAWPACG